MDYSGSGFDEGFYVDESSGENKVLNSSREKLVINPNCDYFDEPKEFYIFIYFNFVAMYILPIFVSIG